MSVEEKQCKVCNRVYRSEQDFLSETSRWRVCSQGHLWFNCTCGSTLMLKRGKFDWWSPEAALGQEARSVFNRLGNLKELPHIPTEVLAIQQVLNTPDVELKVVAREVRKDPVIAAQILQTAEALRNARNPTAAKMTSLDHAIAYIGMKLLKEVVLAGALRTLPLPVSEFDADGYWRESQLIGAIAERLLKRFGPQLNPDEVYLAGSLCNIGKLVQVFCFPPILNKIVRGVSGMGQPLQTWRQSETSYGFPDHCILGEIAAALWGLPVCILVAARRHHELPTLHPTNPTPNLELHELVGVANQFAHWALMRPHRMEDDLVKAFATKAKLSIADIDKIGDEMTTMQRTLALVNVKPSDL